MNVFPLQEGGMNRSYHGADASCMFPQCEFLCPDPEKGIKGTCFRSPTAAHRGTPYFANSRVIDFHEFDKCDDGCEPYYPLHCIEDNECECPLDWGGIGGWPNQEAVWHYYWKYNRNDCTNQNDRFSMGPSSIHALLQPLDRLDLVLLSSMEINDCVAFELMRPIESGSAQLRLKCKDVVVSDVIDLSEPGCLQFWEIPEECRVPDCCIGWDMLQLELLDFPPAADQKKCGDECEGKLHKLAFMTSVMGKNPCTGK